MQQNAGSFPFNEAAGGQFVVVDNGLDAAGFAVRQRILRWTPPAALWNPVKAALGTVHIVLSGFSSIAPNGIALTTGIYAGDPMDISVVA